MTKAGILTLLAAALLAADDQQAALEQKAKSTFDRVALLAQPQLGETIECVEAQAALLPVASRDDTPVTWYRKGYCALMAAALAQNAAGFRDAAAAFDQSTTTWPGRVKPVKGRAPEAGPSVLLVLSAVARLEASAEDAGVRDDLAVGVGRNSCSPDLMTPTACQAVFQTGREWLGWMALRHGDVKEATRYLAGQPGSFWTHWVRGKQAFAEGRYGEAVSAYEFAMQLWQGMQRSAGDWMARLAPQPPMGAALTDLGGARLLAGDPAAAISTLDAALGADPRNARAFYLRARAKEQAGQGEAASEDYNLAVRTALAGAEDLVSGEAHLYRGILLYRRKDFLRAEDEFSSALNAEIAADMRADAVAWRHLAAVAGGACRVSRKLLEESLAAVSPYFPKPDAAAAMARCANSL